MSQIKKAQARAPQQHLEELKVQLREALYLDLDDYGLVEQQGGEFTSTFPPPPTVTLALWNAPAAVTMIRNAIAPSSRK